MLFWGTVVETAARGGIDGRVGDESLFSAGGVWLNSLTSRVRRLLTTLAVEVEDARLVLGDAVCCIFKADDRLGRLGVLRYSSSRVLMGWLAVRHVLTPTRATRCCGTTRSSLREYMNILYSVYEYCLSFLYL